jgi:hypothetical protein
MSKMTADDILRVRKCPSTPYAIAYWFHTHNDDCQSHTAWEDNEYIKLLIDHDRVNMVRRIHEELYDLTHDEDHTEAYDAYVEKCAKISHEPVRYVTYVYEMRKRKEEKASHDKYLDDMADAGATVYQRIRTKVGGVWKYITLPVERYKLGEPVGKRIPK